MESISIPARLPLTIINAQQTTISPLCTFDDEMISIPLVRDQLSHCGIVGDVNDGGLDLSHFQVIELQAVQLLLFVKWISQH